MLLLPMYHSTASWYENPVVPFDILQTIIIHRLLST